MVLRRDLLIATTIAVVIHGFSVLLGLQAFGLPFSQSPPPSTGFQHRQTWALSMAEATEAVNSSSADELLVAPGGIAGAQASDRALSRKVPKPSPEKILASTFSDGFANSKYLALEETDTPAVPAANWILPLKKGYLHEVSSIAVRVWIQQSGSITGVELLDVRPALLSESQMREVVEWLASTPMSPAVKNGETVASKRTLEIAFEH